MPALITVIVLAALLKIFSTAALLAGALWLFGAVEVFQAICRASSSCQPLYPPPWLPLVSVLPFPAFAIYSAWKYWGSGRRLYLNLLIFAIGVPAAVCFSVATGPLTMWDVPADPDFEQHR